MKTRGKFYSNSLSLFIVTIVNFVFPLLTFPYLTRVLEPEIYGVVVFLTAASSYFQLFVDYGFNLSATKEVAENSDDAGKLSEIITSVIVSKLLLSVIGTVMLLVLIPIVPIFRENMILLLLYMIPVILSSFLPVFLFLGIQKMRVVSVRLTVTKAISTCLTFIFVQSKDDVIWVPILSIFGGVLGTLLIWHYLTKKAGLKLSDLRSKQLIFKTINRIRSSTVYFISTIATTAFGAITTLTIGATLTSVEVAYWGVSYTLISSAQALYTPIINALYPHMVSRQDFTLVKKILLIFMPLISLTVFCVSAYSHFIIEIVSGLQYEGAVPVFRTLLWVLVLSFPAQIFGFPVLGVIGKVKAATTTTVIAAVFHIVALLILISFGEITVLKIAVLRCVTEAILLIGRVMVFYRFRKMNSSVGIRS